MAKLWSVLTAVVDDVDPRATYRHDRVITSSVTLSIGVGVQSFVINDFTRRSPKIRLGKLKLLFSLMNLLSEHTIIDCFKLTVFFKLPIFAVLDAAQEHLFFLF